MNSSDCSKDVVLLEVANKVLMFPFVCNMDKLEFLFLISDLGGEEDDTGEESVAGVVFVEGDTEKSSSEPKSVSGGRSVPRCPRIRTRVGNLVFALSGSIKKRRILCDR